MKSVTPGELPPKIMNAIIEIPENSIAKYEFDENSGLLKVSRIMQTPVVYPANYGFFPETRAACLSRPQVSVYLLPTWVVSS